MANSKCEAPKGASHFCLLFRHALFKQEDADTSFRIINRVSDRVRPDPNEVHFGIEHSAIRWARIDLQSKNP